MAVTIPFALAVIYFVQKFYLKTSRQLRLLDLEVKSPLYSNFIETLNGLVTIRAFGWSAQLQELNTKLLDESQKPVYLLYCVQRWLTLVMDMLVACLAIVLIILTVFLKGSTSGGAIGVALVNIMTFNQGLTNMIKWYTSLETALGAISRVKKFESETMSEERTTPTLGVVDQKWPRSGAIEFQNVSASYGFVDRTTPCGRAMNLTVHLLVTSLHWRSETFRCLFRQVRRLVYVVAPAGRSSQSLTPSGSHWILIFPIVERVL